MPRRFFDDFLPRAAEHDDDWVVFYEVKSNMRRREVELLKGAGVTWIQPGIESLSDNVLKLMRKGVPAAYNIQTLRLCAEMGITVSWNLIANFPKETAEDYYAMERFFKHLHHLDPPSGLSPFEVHRFSPFFDQPTEHGVVLKGAHRKYKSVFPTDDDTLDRLVYRFEYSLLNGEDEELTKAHAALTRATEVWTRAQMGGAKFEIELLAGGGARLFDTRSGDQRETDLDAPQTTLLLFMDHARPLTRLKDEFAKAHPREFEDLGGDEGVASLLDRWADLGTIIYLSGMALALPTIKLVAEKSVGQDVAEETKIMA